MTHILIIDDDPQIRSVLRIALREAHFEPFEAGDGPEGLAKAQSGRHQLVVLDVGLPGMDGLSVCRELRKTSSVPVLFLTARNDEIDRLLAFELGGDDYLAKPFSPREVIARIRAILRRNAPDPANGLMRGRLVLDPDTHRCQVDGNAVALTAREMAILAHLMRWPDKVTPRPALCDVVFGPGLTVSDRTLDSHLRNIRAKLSDAGCHNAIDTVHGVGLRMGPCR